MTEYFNTERLLGDLASDWWAEQRRAARAVFNALADIEQQHLRQSFNASGILIHAMGDFWRQAYQNQQAWNQLFNSWLTRNLTQPSDRELLDFGVDTGRISESTARKLKSQKQPSARS